MALYNYMFPGGGIDWPTTWHKFGSATGQEMRELGVEIIREIRSESRAGFGYDKHINALCKVRDHFVQRSNASYEDPEIRHAMLTLRWIKGSMNRNDPQDPEKVIKCAVSVIAYALTTLSKFGTSDMNTPEGYDQWGFSHVVRDFILPNR
jgi:hypothetical protein